MINDTLINSLNAIVVTIEFDGTMSFINQFGQDFTGYTQEEISSQPYFWAEHCLPKTIKPDIKQIVENTSKNGFLVEKNRNEWLDRNGNARMIEWSNSYEVDDKGTPLRLVSIGIDISENIQKDQEIKKLRNKYTKDLEKQVKASIQELEKSKALTDYIIDSAPVRIFWKDINGIYLGANKLFLHDAGLESKDQIIGKTDYDMNWKSVADLYVADDKQVMESGIAKLQYEEPQTYEDGTTIYLITSKIPLKDENDKVFGMLGVYDDITEQKQKDALFMQQSKMAAMGEMLANIAHQWRQPLSVISLEATGLQVAKDFGDMTEEQMNNALINIIHNTQYLSSTIDTFRDFIKGDRNSEEIAVCHLLDESIGITEASLKNHHIQLYNTIYCEEDCGRRVFLSKHEFSQVVINILNNAKDILEERQIKNPWIKLDHQMFDLHVLITIEDNAGGIPEKILPRIFEPYYTTKHSSKGTGLGLHIAYKIITESIGGKLYVNNTENGAKFFIEIPLQ